MDRSWMYGIRTSNEFRRGIDEFCAVAIEHKKKNGLLICCPCHDCNNMRSYNDIREIVDHLIRRGFKRNYTSWIWHGEAFDDAESSTMPVNHDEYKAICKKAKESKMKDVHPHHMGRETYDQKAVGWEKKGLIPSSSTDTEFFNTTDILNNRTLKWVLARSKENEEGIFTIPNEKTKNVMEKIELWNQKVRSGEFQPNRTDDILNRALDRKEHGGRVLGYGGRTTIKDVFGCCQQKNRPIVTEASISEMVQNAVASQVKEQVAVQVKAHLNHLIKMGVQIPNNLMEVVSSPVDAPISMPPVKSSCQSGGVDPFVGLKGNHDCEIALMIESEKVVVARGIAYLDMTKNHCKSVDEKNVVVQIDECEKQYEKALIPVKAQYIEFLGDARGSYIEWPRHLVLISQDKAINPTTKTDKQKQTSGATNESAIYRKKPFCPQKAPPHISMKCNKMKLLVEGSVEDEIIIPFDPKTDFCIPEASANAEIHICAEDVNQILKGELLSVSIVEVFIIALKHHYNDQNFASIGFTCPSLISGAQWEGKSNIEKDSSMRYLTIAMQKYKSKRFILCPYWESHHWILLVICMEKREVYLFDSTINDREIAIKPHLNKAFLSYIQLGPKRISNKAELTWIKAKDFARTEAYTEDEIHEVLDIWAKQIVRTIMST